MRTLPSSHATFSTLCAKHSEAFYARQSHAASGCCAWVEAEKRQLPRVRADRLCDGRRFSR